jgi:ABC-type Fe3+-hydroxamate transport system substrate-binding protein
MTDETTYYYSANVPTTPPNRVLSAVPSMTETLFVLGFGDKVVGITDDCLLPQGQLDNTLRVGPIDALNVTHITDLQPDLVIVNREENTAADIAALQAAGLHVWQTFPRTVHDAMNLIWDTLHLFMVDDRMLYERINLINRTLDWVGGVSEAHEDDPCPVFMPLLRHPLTTCNADTYAHDLLRLTGGHNIFAHKNGPPTSDDPAENTGRYPLVTLEEIQAAQPQIILLPSDPLPFTEDDLEWLTKALDVPATQSGEVYLIDGTLVSYHGVTLARALNEISALMCLAAVKDDPS